MAAKGASALAVTKQGCDIVTSSGTALLQQLAPDVTARVHDAAAVLGLQHPHGAAVAIADFSIGHVSRDRQADTIRYIAIQLSLVRGPLCDMGCGCCTASLPAFDLAPWLTLPAARSGGPALQLNAKRFLALGRTSLWWMTPAWGTDTQEVGNCRGPLRPGTVAREHISACLGVGGAVLATSSHGRCAWLGITSKLSVPIRASALHHRTTKSACRSSSLLRL